MISFKGLSALFSEVVMEAFTNELYEPRPCSPLWLKFTINQQEWQHISKPPILISLYLFSLCVLTVIDTFLAL